MVCLLISVGRLEQRQTAGCLADWLTGDEVLSWMMDANDVTRMFAKLNSRRESFAGARAPISNLNRPVADRGGQSAMAAHPICQWNLPTSWQRIMHGLMGIMQFIVHIKQAKFRIIMPLPTRQGH